MFMGTFSGLFRNDDGTGWEPINKGFPNPGTDFIAAVAVTDAGDVLAGGEVGLFLSTDNGDNWTMVDTA